MNDAERRRSPDGFDDDAIFADIVAHLNDEATDAEQPDGPTAEVAPPVAPGAAADESPADFGDAAPDVETDAEPPPDPAAQVWRADEVDDEYEEHFEPPPVTPLPAGDLQFWAIIAGMTCGPLLLLYLVFFNRYAGGYWILIAIGMSVGGFAMLVSRMPDQHDDDDDGARL